jgi:putative OPT family oligopeptide transporter
MPALGVNRPAGAAGGAEDEAGERDEAPATDDPAARPRAPRELTARALLVGCAIGVVLAAGNVYTGLKTSFIDGGSITAALLAFALFATFRRLARSPFLTLENNITQTTAASAAIMGFVVGLQGPVPALSLMGIHRPAWALAAWGIALGAVAILLAAALRRKLIVAEALPFPTGTATAEVLESIYAEREVALRRARILVSVAVGAMIVTWFRDGRPSVVPQLTLFGAAVAGVSTSRFGIGVSWSPLTFSAGMMMGGRASVGLLLGGIAAWGFLAPRVVDAGIVAGSDFSSCISWLVWPALGLLIAGSFLPLVLDWRALARGLRDLLPFSRDRAAAGGAARAEARIRHARLIVIACCALMLWVGWAGLGLHPVLTAATLLVAGVLASISARTAGETDVAPIGAMGVLTQLLFGSHGPAVSLLASSISSGQSSQSAQTLWALKAGHRLGASPRAQIWAQLLGAVLGGLVVVPVYLVIAKSYGLGTPAMPASAALSAKATAEAVRGGLAAMPKHGPLAGGIAFAVGLVLTLLGRTRAARFVPSPAAMGVAMLTPFSMAFSAFIGGLAVIVVKRARPQAAEGTLMSIAAGGIAGESIMGVAIAFLMAFGLL